MSGFVTYSYLTSKGPALGRVKLTIPIHGRYHEPSLDGKPTTSVEVYAPELLLWSENCKLNDFIYLFIFATLKS